MASSSRTVVDVGLGNRGPPPPYSYYPYLFDISSRLDLVTPLRKPKVVVFEFERTVWLEVQRLASKLTRVFSPFSGWQNYSGLHDSNAAAVFERSTPTRPTPDRLTLTRPTPDRLTLTRPTPDRSTFPDSPSVSLLNGFRTEPNLTHSGCHCSTGPNLT